MKKITQLPKELQVPELRKEYGHNIYLGIGYDPHLFVMKIHKTADVKEWIFERMAEEGLGNMVRCVLYGNWRGAFSHVYHPFRREDGEFLLPDPVKLELNLPEAERMAEVGKYINPNWYRRIMRNTENAIKRGITVILDFNAQWQDWGNMWLNPNKCNRDVWVNTYGQWHYYEYWDDVGGERIRRTGLIIESFERYMRNELLKMGEKHNAKKFIVFSAGNENRAGMGWHKRKSDIFSLPSSQVDMFDLDEDIGELSDVGKHRKITSIEFQDFFYRKPIHQYFQYAPHGIGSMRTYLEKREEMIDGGYMGKWLPCCDGFFPNMPKGRDLKKLVYQSLKDGNLGYELLHGKWESHSLEKWDFDSVKWMMRGFKRWRKEQG